MNKFLFYEPAFSVDTNNLVLSAEESWHIIKVLRYKKGNPLFVTNGNGLIAETEIISDSAKGVELAITAHQRFEPQKPIIRLAISPVKNRETMEWLVEKATEIGVSSLHFFTSEHSERTVLNLERLEKIAISAMKQSLNAFKPVLNPLIPLKILFNEFHADPLQKIMAHCDQPINRHISYIYNKGTDVLLLIGPEGGFSEKEAEEGKCMNFDIVNLGNNRLRTETASIYALTAIHTLNHSK